MEKFVSARGVRSEFRYHMSFDHVPTMDEVKATLKRHGCMEADIDSVKVEVVVDGTGEWVEVKCGPGRIGA
jgi:hypothetical protein